MQPEDDVPPQPAAKKPADTQNPAGEQKPAGVQKPAGAQKPLTPEQKKALLAQRAKKLAAGAAAGSGGAAAATGAGSAKTQVVTLHTEFYRDRVFQMCVITAVTVAIFSLYLFILIYRFTHRPLPIYFEAQRLEVPSVEVAGQNSTTYRLFKPTPLTDPFLTTPALFIWINQSLSDIFSFNFQNSDSHLQQVKRYFTDDGWNEFSKALTESKLISEVQRGRYIINARSVSPPLLSQQGIYKDRFEWHVDIDMYIRYRSSVTDNRQLWKIKVITVRTPVTEDHDRGVAIDYFKVESVRASI